MSALFTLNQALAWLPGARLVGDGTVSVLRVHTDTRSVQPGDLFVALQGERFDGNQFLAEACAKGAVAALCNSEAALRAAGLSGLVVADARQALGALGAAWRACHRLPLIGVTGSNGKTTVTQMVAAILCAAQPQGYLATEGNLNNEIGVPLTVLRLRPTHALAVVELGMNHPGEIAVLAGIAQPTVALVNNAQREHQEFMASIEAVARENGAVIEALGATGTAVFPADDTYTPLWQALAGARAQLTFAVCEAGAGAGVRADVWCAPPSWADGAWAVQAQTPAGALSYTLRVAGLHNVKNSLAAVACALAAGVPLAQIAQGLSSFEPVKGRSRALAVPLGERVLTLVDDSYNANPDSVQAAIEVLADLPGPRLLALGDMGEVGDQGLAFHDEVLRHALARGIDAVLVTGDWMAQAAVPLLAQSGGRLRFFKDFDALQSGALALAPAMGSVLVKGSRFMRMERLVQSLQALAQNEEKPC